MQQKTPKTFLFRILVPSFLLFAAFAFLFDCIVSYYIIPKTDNSGFGKINRILNQKTTEIPVFGSSRGRCSYNPFFMKVNAYNYGIDGFSLGGSIALAETFCSKNPGTPVIINLDYAFWTILGDNSNIVPFINKQPRLKEISIATNEYSWNHSIVGLRYFDYYVDYLRYLIKIWFPDREKVFQGYDYEMNKPVPRLEALAAAIKYQKSNPITISIDTSQVSKLLNLVHSNPKTTFFFIIAPYHKTYFECLSNKQAYTNYLNLIKSNSNTVVLDNVQVSLSDSLFNDNTHINRLGAEKFGKVLSMELRKYAVLKPYFVD